MVINTISLTPNDAIDSLASEIVTQSRPPPEDVSIAVKTFQEALQIEREKLGQNHPKILHTLHHLAIALRDNGYLEMSLEYFKEELNLLREKDGDNRMEMACVLTNIGKIHNQLGETHRAIESLKNSLMIYQFIGLPENHPRLAMTLRILKRLSKKLDVKNPAT